MYVPLPPPSSLVDELDLTCSTSLQALFAPRVIDFDAKRTATNELWSKDVDDNVEIGAADITNAMRASVRHLLVPPTPAVAPSGSGAGTPAVEEPPQVAVVGGALPPIPAAAAAAAPASSFAGSPAPETTSGTPKPLAQPAPAAAAASAPSPAPPPAAAVVAVDVARESSKLPLDVAIVESLLAAGPAEERLKKVAANLLIVGGTGGIHNIGFAVQSRVAPALAVRAPVVKECAYVPCPKEIEPENLAWKGVGALGRLEGAQEMWIRREEWEALGMRAVRERAFYWA